MSIYNLKTKDQYGESGKFLIYNSDGHVITHFYKHNKIVKLMVSYLNKLKTLEPNFTDWFIDEIELMYVTSMYRPYSRESSHNSEHGAADFVLWPFYLNLYLYTLIRKHFPKQNIYISSYNHHLHMDNRKNNSGVETLHYIKTHQILFPRNKEYYLVYNPSKNYITIARGKQANKYKDWLLKYYDLSDSPFFSSIDSFIKREFLKLTQEEQSQDTIKAVSYIFAGLIGLSLFFGGNKNGKKENNN